MNRPSPLETIVVALMVLGTIAVAVGTGFAWGYFAAVAVSL